jgi:hypothetical protein
VEVRGDAARDDTDSRTPRLSNSDELVQPPKPSSTLLVWFCMEATCVSGLRQAER